jgi:hypothetical protein
MMQQKQHRLKCSVVGTKWFYICNTYAHAICWSLYTLTSFNLKTPLLPTTAASGIDVDKSNAIPPINQSRTCDFAENSDSTRDAASRAASLACASTMRWWSCLLTVLPLSDSTSPSSTRRNCSCSSTALRESCSLCAQVTVQRAEKKQRTRKANRNPHSDGEVIIQRANQRKLLRCFYLRCRNRLHAPLPE